MSKPRTRTSKTLRWIEICLLLAGLAGVGIWGWSRVHLAVSEMWANHELNRQIARRPAIAPGPAVPHWVPLPDGALIGRLEIPALNMQLPVREGAGRKTLDVGLGHIRGTAMPGQPGNVGIAGHRDTVFRGLRNIKKDDVIQLQTTLGTYDYQVESTRIVKPTDVAVLRPDGKPEITLVTCYPFYYVGSAPDRFIVKARQINAQTVAQADPPPTAQLPAVAPKSAPAKTAPPKPKTLVAKASHPKPSNTPKNTAIRKVAFWVPAGDSREVVPGIRLGVSRTDFPARRASLWIHVSPEQYAISLREQPAHHAVYFHGHDDGKQRELMITQVNPHSVSGYLAQYPSRRPRVRYASTRY